MESYETTAKLLKIMASICELEDISMHELRLIVDKAMRTIELSGPNLDLQSGEKDAKIIGGSIVENVIIRMLVRD